MIHGGYSYSAETMTPSANHGTTKILDPTDVSYSSTINEHRVVGQQRPATTERLKRDEILWPFGSDNGHDRCDDGGAGGSRGWPVGPEAGSAEAVLALP